MQTRLDDAVGAVLWYCDVVHTVRAVQVTSEKLVEGTLMYCEDVHVVYV